MLFCLVVCLTLLASSFSSLIKTCIYMYIQNLANSIIKYYLGWVGVPALWGGRGQRDGVAGGPAGGGGRQGDAATWGNRTGNRQPAKHIWRDNIITQHDSWILNLLGREGGEWGGRGQPDSAISSTGSPPELNRSFISSPGRLRHQNLLQWIITERGTEIFS